MGKGLLPSAEKENRRGSLCRGRRPRRCRWGQFPLAGSEHHLSFPHFQMAASRRRWRLIHADATPALAVMAIGKIHADPHVLSHLKTIPRQARWFLRHQRFQMPFFAQLDPIRFQNTRILSWHRFGPSFYRSDLYFLPCAPEQNPFAEDAQEAGRGSVKVSCFVSVLRPGKITLTGGINADGCGVFAGCCSGITVSCGNDSLNHSRIGLGRCVCGLTHDFFGLRRGLTRAMGGKDN